MKPCRECEAILLEQRSAYCDFWLNASPETRNLCLAIANLVRGTDEDLARLERLAQPFRPVSAEQLSMEYRREGGPFLGTSASKRIRDAMVRKVKHQTATGHVVKFVAGKKPGEAGGREDDIN